MMSWQICKCQKYEQKKFHPPTKKAYIVSFLQYPPGTKWIYGFGIAGFKKRQGAVLKTTTKKPKKPPTNQNKTKNKQPSRNYK